MTFVITTSKKINLPVKVAARMVVALHQLRHHPGTEILTSHQLRPVVRTARLDRFPYHHCLAIACSRSLAAKANSSLHGVTLPLFAKTPRNHGFFQQSPVYNSPLSSTITDAMSQYWNPSSWHCLSHMNFGFLPSRPFRTTAFLFL